MEDEGFKNFAGVIKICLLPSSLIAYGDCGGVGSATAAGANRGRCIGGEERGASALLAPAPTARAVGARRRVSMSLLRIFPFLSAAHC